ncbi:hypothetical protein [uncultured Maribacter sp.]|uniref:hypothetical protein n=1 Tax=uncultured Maribacter sp. TaxID=431308 RepID=UPI0030EE7B75
MIKKYFNLVLPALFLCFQFSYTQYKNEREFRIRKSQFPSAAISIIEDNVVGIKRLKFYKETDSNKVSFEAKLKMDKLWYSLEFNKEGVLKNIEILINSTDIPNDTYSKIESYLNNDFLKYRIKSLRQQYPSNNNTLEETFKNAFQNLILPSNIYEIVVVDKKEGRNVDYKIQFDAEGNFKKIRTALPPNYDHVLYE